MAGSKRPKGVPKDAIQYVGGPLPPGFDREHAIAIGDWIIDGMPYPASRFAPAPIVEVLPPVPESPPPQEPAEVPVTPEPAPVIEEPLPLAIGPSALDVDQGPMSHNQETP